MKERLQRLSRRVGAETGSVGESEGPKPPPGSRRWVLRLCLGLLGPSRHRRPRPFLSSGLLSRLLVVRAVSAGGSPPPLLLHRQCLGGGGGKGARLCVCVCVCVRL